MGKIRFAARVGLTGRITDPGTHGYGCYCPCSGEEYNLGLMECQASGEIDHANVNQALGVAPTYLCRWEGGNT
jgi:hypothetical protein